MIRALRTIDIHAFEASLSTYIDSRGLVHTWPKNIMHAIEICTVSSQVGLERVNSLDLLCWEYNCTLVINTHIHNDELTYGVTVTNRKWPYDDHASGESIDKACDSAYQHLKNFIDTQGKKPCRSIQI